MVYLYNDILSRYVILDLLLVYFYNDILSRYVILDLLLVYLYNDILSRCHSRFVIAGVVVVVTVVVYCCYYHNSCLLFSAAAAAALNINRIRIGFTVVRIHGFYRARNEIKKNNNKQNKQTSNGITV